MADVVTGDLREWCGRYRDNCYGDQQVRKIWSDPMKIEYDPKADAMYIRLLAGTVVESDEVRPGVVFDFDVAGRVLGIEMLDVSQRTDNHVSWPWSWWGCN